MTQAAWDEILGSWVETRGSQALRLYSDAVNAALVEQWLPSAPGPRVLKTDLFDEAVGEGLYPALRRIGAEVVAVDVSPAVIAAARERYANLQAEVADVRRLPFADCSFDAVVSNSTLDHFESLDALDAALLELRRVLRPHGLLLLTLDNRANPAVAFRNALPGRFLRSSRLVPYPIGATCGPAGLRRRLLAAGFHVELTTAVMHFPRILLRIVAALGLPRSAVSGALAFEALGATPLRYLTGQFAVGVARRV